MTNPDEEDGEEAVQEMSTLDQSNGPPSDHQMRAFSVNSAVSVSIQSDTSWAPDTIKLAREFYLFLTDRDPVVDLNISDAPNMISLNPRKAPQGAK